MCVCSLRYRAWNAHAPYCHLWPVRLYHISPNYLINGMIFGKKKFNIQCVFWTSLHLSAACFIRRTIQRNIIVNVHGYSCKVPVIFIRFQQGLNFLDKFLKKKNAQKNFMRILPVGVELCHAADVRMDWCEEANSLDFKLSTCSECSILYFGWILCADVSEHSVPYT